MSIRPLVESRCDAVVAPRNEKVVGSIPTGGSTSPDCGPDSTRGARQRGVARSACLGQHWQGGQAGTRPARAGWTGAGPGRRTAARPARHARRIPLWVEVGWVPSLNRVYCRRCQLTNGVGVDGSPVARNARPNPARPTLTARRTVCICITGHLAFARTAASTGCRRQAWSTGHPSA